MALLYTIASGSSGNCVLVSDGESMILVDAGISMRRIVIGLNALGAGLKDISAIFVTHEHTDHISGLPMIAKQFKIPIFASCLTARSLHEKIPYADVNVLQPDTEYRHEKMELLPFPTPHDTPESFGYSIKLAGRRITLVTDLGYVPKYILEYIKGSDMLYIEANHDINALKTGRYPAFLKKRILGERGHLSNAACADTVLEAARSGTRRVLLAHLSAENNTPSLAYETVRARLDAAGIRVGRDVELSVAPRERAENICYI